MYRKVVIALATFSLTLPLLASAASCPNLTRNLSFGSRGNDVVQLQQFLIAQKDLAAGNNTGYFGRLTEAAVKSWQAKNGVVSSGSAAMTGWGTVGPKTRLAVAKCFSKQGSDPIVSELQIISPAEDEVWQIGTPHRIKWRLGGGTYVARGSLYQCVRFQDERGNIFKPPMCDSVTGDQYGERTIIVPHYFVEIRPGTYHLALEIHDTIPSLPCVGCAGYNELIGSATSTHWITLTSPPANLQPAILSVEQSGAKTGDTVTVHGVSFSTDVKAKIEIHLGSISSEIPVTVNRTSSETLSFVIPSVCKSPADCAAVNPNTTYWVRVETASGMSNVHGLNISRE